MQTTANLITTGYWATRGIIPGRILNHWVGTAVIAEPDIDWDVYDNLGKPLPVPAGTLIHMTKLQLHDDLLSASGYAIKLGASATDNNAYVVSTVGAGSDALIVKATRLTVPATPFAVTQNFTLGLYLHSNNSAPSGNNRAQAAQSTPFNTLSPSSARPKPVRVSAEIYWSIPDDGSLDSMDITPCPAHQRLLQGLQ